MGGELMAGDVGVVATATEAAKNLTIVTALIIALLGGAFEWYVWGRTHRRTIADYEKRLADQEAEHARQLAEKAAELTRREAEIEWWQRLTLRATEVADWATRGYADGSPPGPGGASERGRLGGR